jgi:hypothetical protein
VQAVNKVDDVKVRDPDGESIDQEQARHAFYPVIQGKRMILFSLMFILKIRKRISEIGTDLAALRRTLLLERSPI